MTPVTACRQIFWEKMNTLATLLFPVFSAIALLEKAPDFRKNRFPFLSSASRKMNIGLSVPCPKDLFVREFRINICLWFLRNKLNPNQLGFH